MSSRDKVVWSQGMFLQPHHFQQESRALEHLIDERVQAVDPHGWGLAELQLDSSILPKGQIGLTQARGILNDGTPFSVSDHEQLPEPLDIGTDVKGELIYLAAPRQRSDVTAFDLGLDGNAPGLARFGVMEVPMRDQTNATDDPQPIQVGRLRLKLLRGRDLTGAWAGTSVARVIERKPDGQVVLDHQHIPAQTCLHATEHLHTWAKRLHGGIQQFAQVLAKRMGSTAEGVSDIAAFLMLIAFNRHEPLLRQFVGGPQVHPAVFHRACLQLAGELSSFDSDRRTPREFPLYRHDDLQATFEPLIQVLLDQIGRIPVPRATPITLTDYKHGFRGAVVRETELLASARFVLDVHAQLPAEQLTQRFLAHAKAAPAERIKELVTLALPGIVMRGLPVAPRQLPFHEGHHYFEIQRDGDLWKQFERSGNLALFVAGDFPGLELQLWAIRPDRAGH